MDNQITLANRNNNPGNLKDPATGTFKTFNSPQEGYAALLNDLEVKKKGQSKSGLTPESTLADFSKVYAPSSDKNNPAQYTANLANHMKVRPDSKLKDLDTGRWAEAIAHSEGYKGAISPQSNSVQTPSTNEEKPKQGFLSSVAHGIIDPVATMVARPFQAIAELAGASSEDVDKFSKEHLGGFVAPVPQNASDVVKDIGRGAQTVALGMPVGTLGGAAKAGAVMGAGGGLEQNPSVSGAVTGGLLGAGLGLGGGLVSKALGAIPKSLTSSAFKDLSPQEIEKALQTKKIGTSNSLLKQSQKAVEDYGNQIDKLLADSKKVGIGGVVGGGSGNDAIRQTISQFPEYNSDKGMAKMLSKIKNLIPSTVPGKYSRGTIVGLIDKIANGTATLTEKNAVRSAIDSATKGGYAKLAKALNPSMGHDLAMTFADALRGEVQNWIPETQPIFAEFTKEMGFRNAVQQAINKGKTGILGWNDIVPFMLGNNLGGLPGGLTGVAIEKGARNPAIQFGVAKGFKGLGKVVKPIANRAGLVSGLAQK